MQDVQFNILDLINFADPDNELSIDDVQFESADAFRAFLSNPQNNFSEIVVSGEYKNPQTKERGLVCVTVRQDKTGVREFACVCPSYDDYLLMTEIDSLI